MPKFYVTTGKFRNVINAQDPETAAVESFRNNLDVDYLGIITQVNEKGFESDDHEDNFVFDTQELLEKSGQMANYKNKEWLE